MPDEQMEIRKKGPSLAVSLVLLIFGGGAAMIVLSLFLTGLAQKEIIPRIRARAAKAVATAQAHRPSPSPASSTAPAAVDSALVNPADSLGALATQLETQRKILDSQREELGRIRGGIDSVLARHREVQGKELMRQAKLLAGMRPEEAAKILAAMDDASLSALLGAMNARAAAKVLARLDAQRVAQLSMAAIGAGEEQAAGAPAEFPAAVEPAAGQ